MVILEAKAFSISYICLNVLLILCLEIRRVNKVVVVVVVKSKSNVKNFGLEGFEKYSNLLSSTEKRTLT